MNSSDEWSHWDANPSGLAEMQVIGACLLWAPECVNAALRLKPEDFESPIRQHLFEAISGLSFDGVQVDTGTVLQRIKFSHPDSYRGNAALEAIDSAYSAYSLRTEIEAAQESAISPANLEHNIKIIRESSAKRQLQARLAEVSALDLSTSSRSEILAEIGKLTSADDGASDDLEPLNKILGRVWRNAEKAAQNPGMRGLRIGLRCVDNRIGGWLPGQMIVIGARPGGGKSALLLQAAERTAADGGGVIFASLEMAPNDLAIRTLTASTSIRVTNIQRGDLTPEDWNKLAAGMANVERDGIGGRIGIVYSPRMTVADLRSVALHERARGPVAMIIVDYLQLVRPPKGTKYGTREAEVASVSRDLKALAGELGCPVVAGVQTSRETEKRGGWPMLSDIRESGAVEADADMVMFLHRPYAKTKAVEDIAKAGIEVAKHRNGATFRIDVDEGIEFEPRRMRFVGTE